MSRYRGMKLAGAVRFKGNIKVRRSIDLRELGDFGSITDTAVDLPTAGAVHRKETGGSTSATREYANLSTIADLVVVDTQDMGSITDDNATVIHNNIIDYKY